MKKSRKKLYIRLAAVLFVAWVALSASAFAMMRQPIDTLCQIMARTPMIVMGLVPFESMWNIARAGDLQPGDTAPEFDLPREDGKENVTLSQFRGKKPVALVFGSYTWPPFRREVPALNKLNTRFKEKAAFFIVYIQEAHTTTAWQMDKNEEDQVLFADPTDLTERTSIATSCVVDLGIEFPALVDPIDNRTELAYTAWPERIYLVGADGRIILKTKPGPFGFEPDELEAELEKLFPDVPELPEEARDDEAGTENEGSPAAIPPLFK